MSQHNKRLNNEAFINECVGNVIKDLQNEGMFDSIKSAFSGVKNVANNAKDQVRSTYNNAKESYKQGKLEQDKKNAENDIKKLVKNNIQLFKKYKELNGKDGAMVFANMIRRELANL